MTMTPQFLPGAVSREISKLPEPSDDQIQDGLTNEFRYVPLTNSFDTLAVDQLRTVRLANGMRPYILPISIPRGLLNGYDTFQRQYSMPPGSWLIGFISAYSENATVARVSLKDSCTGLPLSSDFLSGRTFYTGLETPLGISPLACARLIGDPGTIDFEIAQINGDQNFEFYLVLLFASPIVALPVRRYLTAGGIHA